MAKRSFDVCGITTTDNSKVRNGAFYESCMENANKHVQDGDDTVPKMILLLCNNLCQFIVWEKHIIVENENFLISLL